MDNYAKNNKIFVIEHSTAKDSNIDRNDAVSNIANALDIDIELLFEKREDNEEK